MVAKRLGNVKGRNHTEDIGIDGMIMLKCALKKLRRDGEIIWLRIGVIGGIFCTWE
jgi:hypothetical protein